MNISKLLQQNNKNTGYACSEFHAGAMVTSSWHRQEDEVTQAEMNTAEGMIGVGRRTGALPTRIVKTSLASVEIEQVQDALGNMIDQVKVLAHGPDQMQGITCYFGKDENGEERPAKLVGAVGGKFKPLPVASFEDLIRAAYNAGCRGEAIFSLRNGARLIASFELPATVGGGRFKQYLTIIDSLDGSGMLQVIISTVRVVCANTVRSAQATSSAGQKISVRHTGDIEAKAAALALAIEAAVRQGTEVVQEYDAATKRSLTDDQWTEALDGFIPLHETSTDRETGREVPRLGADGVPVPLGARALKKAQKARRQVNQAARLTVNVEGDGRNHATLYNALTWCVDRKLVTPDGDGSMVEPAPRYTACPALVDGEDMRTPEDKANERLASVVDPRGTFSKELAVINEVFSHQVEQYKVLVNMADGSTEEMTVDQAVDAGLPDSQIAPDLLELAMS